MIRLARREKLLAAGLVIFILPGLRHSIGLYLKIGRSLKKFVH